MRLSEYHAYYGMIPLAGDRPHVYVVSNNAIRFDHPYELTPYGNDTPPHYLADHPHAGIQILSPDTVIAVENTPPGIPAGTLVDVITVREFHTRYGERLAPGGIAAPMVFMVREDKGVTRLLLSYIYMMRLDVITIGGSAFYTLFRAESTPDATISKFALNPQDRIAVVVRGSFELGTLETLTHYGLYMDVPTPIDTDTPPISPPHFPVDTGEV